MAIPFRTDQSASDVATGEATQVEHYNNALDDIGLAQTEFDKATAAAIAGASPDQAQAAVDTDNDLLYVCLDGVSFTKIGPVSTMAGNHWQNAGAVNSYVSWGGNSTDSEAPHTAPIPYDCVFKNFYTRVDTAPSSPDNFVVSLIKNGSPAGLTLTMQDTDEASDTAIEISFSAGDTFVWQIDPFSGPASVSGSTSWEIVDARTG